MFRARLAPSLLAVAALGACGNAASTASGPGQANDADGSLVDGSGDGGALGDAAGGGPQRPDVSFLSAPCNGSALLCDKTYDAVAYPTTHAAMANVTPPFACLAQRLPVRTQLDQGIRALDLEVHEATAEPGDSGSPEGGKAPDAGTAAAPDAGDAAASDAGDAAASHAGTDGGAPLELCLGDCSDGETALAAALSDVRSFLAANPREVVTLLLEGGVNAGDLASAIEAAHLDGLSLLHAAGDPWPTLSSLIESTQRLVILADVTGNGPPWMLPLWSYVSETGRLFTSLSAMTCDVTRGAQAAPLFLVNEYLVATGDAGVCGTPDLAHAANANPFFSTRVAACAASHGTAPTFVAVDDYDDGDVIGVTQALNGDL